MLLLISLISGIFIDLKIFLIVLLVVSVLIPNILMWLYYQYGLKGECYINVIHHRVVTTEDGFNIEFIAPVASDEDEASDSTILGVATQAKEEVRVRHYSKGSLGKYTVGTDYVVFPFLDPLKGFLYLPLSAYPDADMFGEAVKELSRE